jgi:preprotein translocase subunit Sss1
MSQSPLVKIFYPIETALKLIFVVITPFNLPFTLITAFLASVIGLLRVAKKPQFNKEYLAKVLMNNHGQNILYVSFGAIGFTNYLYYSPIVLFFAFGVV